jgi:ubiquinone/menaquinone biosynthesis C-methylase UbiE
MMGGLTDFDVDPLEHSSAPVPLQETPILCGKNPNMTPTDADFDQYDRQYQKLVEDSISFSGVNHDYVTRIKADLIVEVARRRFGDLKGRRVLDVGCGVGLTDRCLAGHAWQVSATDVSSKSIEQARQRNPNVSYVVGDENRLPFEDSTFDVCFTICVMHHVPPEKWTTFLREMRRVLKPDGVAMVLEHNPFNPLTRLAVNRCPFDANAVLLSNNTLKRELSAAELKPLGTSFFLFTPWERLRFLDRLLGWLPFGAQYCVVAAR